MNTESVTVLVVEDDENFRRAVVDLIMDDDQLRLVGAAADIPAAIDEARSSQPQVVLLDVMLPAGSGDLAARGIREVSPHTRVVAMSPHDDRDTVLRMLRAGAVGYLLKGTPSDQIVGAIVNAANGESILSREVAAQVIQALVDLLEGSEVLNEELQKLHDVKAELIQILGHELKTPITVIRSNVALIAARHASVSADQLEQLAQGTARATSRISRLTDIVTTLADLELGRLKPELGAVKVSDLLDVARKALVEEDHRFVTRATAETLASRVRADIHLFPKALSAVMENALQLSPPDESVEVDVSLEKGKAVISISDRGPGIPHILSESIFEPFFQVNASTTRVHQGAGLGLYFARRVLREQEADIAHEQRPGGGTTFRIEVPADSSSPYDRR